MYLISRNKTVLEKIKSMCVEVKKKLEQRTLARSLRNPTMKVASMVDEESLPDRLVRPELYYSNDIVNAVHPVTSSTQF